MPTEVFGCLWEIPILFGPYCGDPDSNTMKANLLDLYTS